MPRLIDADALTERLTEARLNGADDWDMMDTINTAPTIEAVSVVRCKDCRWQNFCANFNVFGFYGDDYCSMGERRKDGEND